MIEIRRVTNEQEFQAVARFRYEIYVEEMKRPQKDADHARRVIVDTLDNHASRLFAAWNGVEIVGTVRSNYLRCSTVGAYEEYYSLRTLNDVNRRKASVTTRLMLRCDMRRGMLATRLAVATYADGLANGIEFDFIDCNSHLVSYFTGLGYRVHRAGVVHPEYGEITVMRLDLCDEVHLEAVKSPFCRDVRLHHANIATSTGAKT